MTEKDAPNPQILANLVTQLMTVLEQLPFIKQTPEERRADGHLLFLCARDFTAQARFPLEARPALYTDLPEDAATIARSQQLADSYYELAFLLKTMARLCQDSHYYYQADAVRRSKANLDHVLYCLRGVRRGNREAANFHRRRAGFLDPAFAILREVRGHIPGRKTPKRPKPGTEPGTQPGSPQPGTEPGTQTPPKKPPRARSRASTGARLFAAFVASLKRGR